VSVALFFGGSLAAAAASLACASAARERRSLFSTQSAYERPALVMSAFSADTESVVMSPSVWCSMLFSNED